MTGLTLTVSLGGQAACGSDPAGTVGAGQAGTAARKAGGSTNPTPRWPAPTDAAARVAAAGLDLGPMGMAEHYHPQLRIVVDGQDVQVPGDIGVDPTTGAMPAVHTHEPDGRSISRPVRAVRSSPSASRSPNGASP